MLPQQSLMLQVARRGDPGRQVGLETPLRTGVLIGIGLDLNTTNFHQRWSLPDRAREWNQKLSLGLTQAALARWIEELREASGPPLTANRTMGSLGGLVASRIAREFRIGGPSFSVSCDETSGIQAMAIAIEWLRRGELDAAIVGAVDLAGDPQARHLARQATPSRLSCGSTSIEPTACASDAAVSLVLKRLDVAERDGDRVYAVIRGFGAATRGIGGGPAVGPDPRAVAARLAMGQANVPAPSIGLLEIQGGGCDQVGHGVLVEHSTGLGSLDADIGEAGAAAGLASTARAALCLYHRILPSDHKPGQRDRAWLKDRVEGPRRAGVSALSLGGNGLHVILEESSSPEIPATVYGSPSVREMESSGRSTTADTARLLSRVEVGL